MAMVAIARSPNIDTVEWPSWWSDVRMFCKAGEEIEISESCQAHASAKVTALGLQTRHDLRIIRNIENIFQ